MINNTRFHDLGSKGQGDVFHYSASAVCPRAAQVAGKGPRGDENTHEVPGQQGFLSGACRCQERKNIASLPVSSSGESSQLKIIGERNKLDSFQGQLGRGAPHIFSLGWVDGHGYIKRRMRASNR
ncbi:hypothetical protein VTO42DRAFT_7364 [Malbranchea cinnamomea]